MGRYDSDPSKAQHAFVLGPRSTLSLWVQLVLVSVGLILLTATLIGLPAIWLTGSHLDRRAWAQLDQGSRASRALYAARWSELVSLSSLTAQRPNLHSLLIAGDETSLESYLNTLRTGANVDALFICDSSDHVVAAAGVSLFGPMCPQDDGHNPLVLTAGTTPELWLVASHWLDESPVPEYRTLVARRLAGEFVAQMRTQTGLEQTLFSGDQILVTSYAGGIGVWRDAERRLVSAPADGDGSRRSTFTVDGVPFLATRFTLGEPGIQVEVSLPVADIEAAKRRLTATLLGTMIGVSLLGSALGVLLARRTGRPLARVADRAATLSEGNLDAPIRVETRIREVAKLELALESARVKLGAAWGELEQERDWINHLLESIVEGIVTLDSNGRITYFSRGAARITGWRRSDVLGRSCDEVFQLSEGEGSFSQFIPAPGKRHKMTVRLANGDQAILAITGARLIPPESGDARVALVFRDVSEEEAVHRLLGGFLANIAHEFRTPLSSLAASIELLMDQAPDLSQAESQELLDSLHLGVVGLQTLVDNLLESASIEAGHFRVFPCVTEIEPIVAEATASIRPLLDKRRQRLSVDLPASLPKVKADPRRTVQVLVNLLFNANKYSPDGAEIVVSVRAGDRWMHISVLDEGPGVPVEYRRNLFRRFMHSLSEHRYSQYGAGLGLSVVKAIIEALGGEVGISDRANGGSAFWFTLPVEGAE